MEEDPPPLPNPIIVALDGGEPLAVIRSIVEGNPDLLRHRDDEGYLPVHRAFNGISTVGKDVALYLLGAWPDSIRERTHDEERLLPAHLVCMRAGVLWLGENEGAVLDAVRTVVEADPRALQWGDGEGRLPLHLAFRYGAPPPAVTRYLVERHRPALRSRDNEGWVPLHHAARDSTATLPDVRYLAGEWTGSVFITTNRGETPLFLAVRYGTPMDVVEFLAAQNPGSIRQVDDEGRTPLHEAARNANLAAARWLLRSWPGAAHHASHDGRLPLHEAAWEGSVEMSQLLVERHPQAVRQRRHDGRIPLHEAAALVRTDAVRYLAGLCPESARAATNDGWLPIHCALKYRPWCDEGMERALEVAESLVRTHPESVWEATSDGLLPLHIAAGHGNVLGVDEEEGYFEYEDYVESRLLMGPEFELSLVRLLVAQAPATIGALSNEGMLPVHSAITGGVSVPAVRYLLEKWLEDGRPESVQYRAGSGQSVLHLAVSREIPSMEHVQSLVRRRPSLLRETDPRGFTPLHCAVKHNQCLHVWLYLIQQRRRYLFQRNNDGALPLHVYLASVAIPSWMRVQFLVDKHPKALAEADNEGSLPLHIAVSRSDVPLDVVECLVEEHPEALDAVDHNGSLALHLAVSRSSASPDMVGLLVEAQPQSIRRKNGSGFLPLHVAALNDAPVDVLHYLLSKDPSSIEHESPAAEHVRPHKLPKLR